VTVSIYCTLSETIQGKASNSPGRREGRAIYRCCDLPSCQKRRDPTIYQRRKAWRQQRAWHRSRCIASDGRAYIRYSLPTTIPILSRSYAPSSQGTDYVGVSEAVGFQPLRSVTT